MLDWWWAYLALGAFAGFFSGLPGIGGARRLKKIFVLVPFSLATSMLVRFF